MNAAVPVACILVAESGHDTGLGYNVCVVETRMTEIAADLKVAYPGKSTDGHGCSIALVVARERKVHACAVLARGNEADGILHHGKGAREMVILCVKRGICSYEDHVTRDSWRPDPLGVVQELDGAETGVAEAVRNNDCLVFGKVGRRHSVPFVLVLANMGRQPQLHCLVVLGVF